MTCHVMSPIQSELSSLKHCSHPGCPWFSSRYTCEYRHEGDFLTACVMYKHTRDLSLFVFDHVQQGRGFCKP